MTLGIVRGIVMTIMQFFFFLGWNREVSIKKIEIICNATSQG